MWGKTRAFACYGKAGLYEMPKTSKGGEGFMKWDGVGMEEVPRRIVLVLLVDPVAMFILLVECG